MEALGGSQNPAAGTTVHTLQLSGLLTGGGGKILARCRMTYSRGEGVTLEVGVRGEKEDACRLVIAAIGG
jgi:coatomer protein complex subunit gamma